MEVFTIQILLLDNAIDSLEWSFGKDKLMEMIKKIINYMSNKAHTI